MADQVSESPWLQLEALANSATPAEIEAFLEALPAGEVGRSLLRLSEEVRAQILQALPPESAAQVLEQIPESEAADLLESIEPTEAAAIVEELPSDERADILRDVEEQDAEEILSRLPISTEREARALTEYPDDCAGGLMITEYLNYPQEQTVGGVVHDIRANVDKYRDFDVQYAYVTGPRGVLAGVLNMRQLFMSSEHTPVSNVMVREPISVRETASVDELRDLFDRHNFMAVPVVDSDRRLLGLVRAADVEEALRERGDSDFRKSQGIIGGDELRTMPVLTRVRRRLSWLSVNVLLNILAASVIAFYQDTLAAVIALAVFLPIISDMSGCSGNQAVAVSIRELTLGLVRPTELLRVWVSELVVGVCNGAALGALIAAVAWWWKGNPVLGLVVGLALACNTLVAVSVGGLVPLFLKRLKMDPALASGPILTTITDMCGFFLVLSLASVWLRHLVV
ncbi:MAG: magnesium transporter [Phycisphaerae bacterium]